MLSIAPLGASCTRRKVLLLRQIAWGNSTKSRRYTTGRDPARVSFCGKSGGGRVLTDRSVDILRPFRIYPDKGDTDELGALVTRRSTTDCRRLDTVGCDEAGD